MSQYIYTMNGVSKIVPPKRQIIKDISLSFFPGAKIGLLGLNGAGKSTVLKIMAGVDTDFSGEAAPAAGIKVGYLAQEPQLNPEHTVREAVEEGVGEVLQGPGRAGQRSMRPMPRKAPTSTSWPPNSSAWKPSWPTTTPTPWNTSWTWPPTRCACRRGTPSSASSPAARSAAWRCASLLLQKPDMLLLDEPTNHLDAESVEWLEQFLARYTGTVVAVTHDRYFLDNVAEWILELDRGQRHPVEGQLHRLAGTERRAPEAGREPGKGAPEGAGQGTGVGAQQRQGRPQQGQGAHGALRGAATRSNTRSATRPTRSSSRRASAWASR